MRYSQLLNIVGDNVLFETPLLVAGASSMQQIHRRLTDWTKAGKITPLRRGLYVLPKGLRRTDPHPFVIANRLVAGSYVSLEMALRYYSLIPEHVAVITSVTTGRPGRWENEFGRFSARHLDRRYFFGIEYRQVLKAQYAYIAYPEKALLDLLYLRAKGDSPAFIDSLRLQNLEQLNLTRLQHFADRFNKPKLHRAAAIIRQLALEEADEYEPL